MKNKEKYAKEIVELACDGNRIAIVRKTGEFRSCYETQCRECLFHSCDTEQCKEKAREWAESEYIEKSVIVISKKDRAFLEYLKEEFKYIVRYKDGALFAYKNQLTTWFRLDCRFDVCFPMIKWEGNEEIWSIKDLKKLEVVEEYEENSR
ncbi:MAG: hypothetical protein [Bacteriophage sp.]|jgi:hypothetical protein|nr:MAG: hypothetical protein [Bacteriophage sp.]